MRLSEDESGGKQTRSASVPSRLSYLPAHQPPLPHLIHFMYTVNLVVPLFYIALPIPLDARKHFNITYFIAFP